MCLTLYGKSCWSETRFRGAGEASFPGSQASAEWEPEPIRGGSPGPRLPTDRESRAEEFQVGGLEALQKAGRAGRKPELSEGDRKRLEELLVQGPEKLGYETPLWTCARVAHLIDNEFGIEYHPGHVWKILDDLGWSC